MAPTNAGGKPNKTGGIKPDKLSREELARTYGYALEVIYSVPELKQLFERAVNAKQGQYTTQKFSAELQNTKWYRENDQYYRSAWTAEQIGGADWQTELENARLAVQQAATDAGAQLTPEELNALSKRYIYEGWKSSERSALLRNALSEEISSIPSGGGEQMRGAAGNLSDRLKTMAYANGMKYNNDWYVSAAKSVSSGLTTAEDWERDIRESAASLFPVFGEKIRAGMNVMDAASPYIQTMAQTFEMNPASINLNDPYIRQALGGFDQSGSPVAMGLWDFEQKLRSDPRWMKTKQAEDSIVDIGSGILKMFGFRG
jgi:hypothetical protein